MKTTETGTSLPTTERSVAILRDDHIGDLVLTTSLMQTLHEDGWEVDVVGSSATVLLERSTFVRNVATLRSICPNWPRDWTLLADWLKKRNYTATIIPFCRPIQLLRASQRAGASHRIAMGTTLKSRILATWHRHLFFPTNFFDRPRPYYEIMVDCAAPLVANPTTRRPEIQLTPDEIEQGRKLVGSHLDGICHVGVHPTCFGNTCNLPLETYRELAVLILQETTWSVVVTGGPGDKALLGGWQEFAIRYPRRIWLSAGELGLRELASVLSGISAFVSTGTGPMHLAQAVGARTVSPFCPQRPICPVIWGYTPYEETSVLPANPPCDPDRHHGKNCDFQGSLTARDLLNRLHQILDQVP